MTKEEVYSWEWNPKQVSFIQTPSRFAAYIGGMGCGKTSALCRRAIAIATKYPGSRGILFRFSYTEVNNILIPQFFEVLPAPLIHKWRRSEGMLEIKTDTGEYGAYTGDNVSTILFRNLDDVKKYRSENLSLFGISQADDAGITEEHWTELIGRLRRPVSATPYRSKQYGFLEGNYRGHNWIWRIFTTEGQKASGRINQDGSLIYGKDGKPIFDPSQHFLVEGSTLDNAANLPAEYLKDLEAMPEEFKRRHVYGSWEEHGGLVYEEFGPQHISDKYFSNGQWVNTIPDWWNRFRSIDHGTRNPTAALWVATSPSGTIHVYDEYISPGLARQHARNIRRKYARKDPATGEWYPTETYKFTVLDRSAFSIEGTSGESPAHQYLEEGIPVVRSPKHEPVAGITTVKKLLTSIDPKTNLPRLQIHPRCHNLIQEMKEYVWDELGPARRYKRNEPERPRKVKDHLVDCLRYIVMCSPPASRDISDPASKSSQSHNKSIYRDMWEV